jgi:diadenosine tetraphosphate (Ap4A) HIT family hydrolase
MSKKLVCFILLLAVVIGITLFPLTKSMDGPCPFCDGHQLNLQKFYEDELVIALYTHKPVFPGHSLIIPKRHVERFEMLSEDEMIHIGNTIKKVNQAAETVFGTASYLLLQKNGLEVGQTVPHLHFHYIPRHLGDDSTLKFMFKMYVANFKNPITPAEIKEITDLMKAAMEQQ